MSETDLETLTVFLEESFEGLGRAESMLLELENGAAPAELLNALFREIHTIKGTSSFLDLSKIVSITHAAEDVLGKLRDGSLTLTSDMVTILLEAADALRTLLNDVKQHSREGAQPVAHLVERLRAYLPGAREARREAARTTGPTFHLLVAHGDEAEARRLGELLSPFGAIPECVTHGGQVLGKIRALRPGDPQTVAEVLLLTTDLAGIDGLDVAARYFGSDKPVPKIPFVFLVGSKDEGDAILARTGSTFVEYALMADGQALTEQLRAAISRAKIAQSAGTGEGVRSVEEATIRIGVGLIDQLMNLVGELVLARNQILQIANSDKDARANVMATAQRLNIVTSELQEQVMRTRMQPISRLFDQIPRMVRSISRATSKEVACLIEGNATELDRTFIELVRDPLMHIVRNAIDHGIEAPDARRLAGKPTAGSLRVRAYHEGGSVNIQIEDDGRGLDPKKLRSRAVERGLITFSEASQLSDGEAVDLIFRPGFSTAETVTDISGRGVGMDVVRTQVERAGGHVEVSSAMGRGTTVRLKIPLTLAIIPALLVTSSGQRFAIPQVNVLELVHLDEAEAHAQIERVRGASIFRLRGTVLPLLHLGEALRIARPRSPADGINIVVVAAGDRRYGIVVDGVEDTVEIVVKPMHRTLKRLTCYAGATILGDGTLALILDVLGIAAHASMKVGAGRGQGAHGPKPPAAAQSESFLVFVAGETRCAVPLSTVSRIERVPADSIERVAGRELLQYRNAIMPVLRAEDFLPLGRGSRHEEQPVVVFDFGSPVGVAVDSIVDIVDSEPAPVRTRDAADGILGSQVFLGKTTIVLDIFGLVQRVSPKHATEDGTTPRTPRVLVVDDSLLMRSVISGYLRSAGYDAVAIASGDQVVSHLDGSRQEGRPFDAVITDVEMPGTDGASLTLTIKQHAAHKTVPVVIVSKHDLPHLQQIAAACGADGYVHKLDRSDLLAKVGAVVPGTRRSAAA